MEIEAMATIVIALCSALFVTTTGMEPPQISGPDEMLAGESSTYQCSAVCDSVCKYIWEVDGQTTASGNTLTLTADGRSSRLELKCIALDSKEGEPHIVFRTVQVINPFSVNPTSPEWPKVGWPFNLTCSGSSPSTPTLWLKDGQPITVDTRMYLSPDNRTLLFRFLNFSDSAYYTCEVNVRGVQVRSVGYSIGFNFQSVGVSGPEEVEVGEEAIFHCKARCGIDCSVRWQLNSGIPRGLFCVDGPEIRWTPSDLGQVQIFTCIAEITDAQRLIQVSKPVKVIGKGTKPKRSGSVVLRPGGYITIILTLVLLFLLCA